MSISTLDQDFVSTFWLAALQAGAVAKHLQGKVQAERKGGESPESEALTAADLATQDVILHLLHDQLPDVAMDAEEDTPALSLFEGADPQAALVVVDPVDGTLNYIRGSDDYAVMGALLREQRYTAAVIYFPVYGTCYWAIRGEGCFGVDADGREQRRSVGQAADRILHAPHIPEPWSARLGAHAAEVALCRCSAVDGSAPATGYAKAAVAAERADRRRAIALFLSLEAGATVRMGEHLWQGEDPETLPATLGPTIVADTAQRADAIARSLAAHHHQTTTAAASNANPSAM